MISFRLIDALFWVLTVPAVAASLAGIKRSRRLLEYVEDSTREFSEEPSQGGPTVALIVPVKGVEEGLAGNLRALADQDYPSYTIFVCCADANDPALSVVRNTLGLDCRIVIAEDSPPNLGEKVHNLRAAVAEVGNSAEILVFADSDGRVPPDWLRKLTASLDTPGLGAASTFRWYMPERGGFWSLMRAVWDAAIIGVMDTKDRSFAWGGGMAVRRQVFESARVLDYWRGTVSDDYRLTSAMRAAGLGIRFVPEAMVPTTGHCSAREFLDWSVRQLTICRVHDFRMWILGVISHVLYCGALMICVVYTALGNPLGLAGLLLVLLPASAVGGMRATVCALVFPDREEWLEKYGWAYFWLTPVATWVWMYALAKSGLSRRITWRGRTYELRAADDTCELGRG